MKKIKVLLLAGIFVLMFVPFVGCNSSEKTEGYFVYEYHSGKKEIRIIGLTDEGKNQTYLEFPAYIEGKPVTELGRDGHGGMWSKNKVLYGVILDTTYLPATIKMVGNECFERCRKIRNVYILSADGIKLGSDYGIPFHETTNVIVYHPNIQNYEIIWGARGTDVWTPRAETAPAQVSFYYNYENSPNRDFYWIISLQSPPSSLLKPKDPVREGYLFNGWYQEAECLTAFDFTEMYPKTIKDEDTGSDKLNYIDIFAGWVKI